VKDELEQTLREQLCEIGRRLWTRQLCAGSDGNLSVRLGSDRYLCTPTGHSKGFLSTDLICRADAGPEQPSESHRLSSEWAMHRAIYDERPDVHAIIHSHPPTATGFALAHRLPATWVYAEADVLLHPIAMVPYVTPGDSRLAAAARSAARGSDVLLLANHGAVCVAESLEQAYFKMEMLEAFAQILIAAERVGGAKQFLTPEQGELAALRRKLRGDRFGPSSPRNKPGS